MGIKLKNKNELKNISTKIFCCIFLTLFLCSFQPSPSLKGTWEFVGGIYNGKREGAPKEYSLHRKYNLTGYEAFVIEKGYKAQKYEAGTFVFKGDTCVDTESFSAQPSKITNIPIHYIYTLKNDTLTLKGTLPTGMRVEEYWKKIR
ncbi:MAG TPA: hypothetical protein VNX40_16665 [Mucilaginibacter sp.]|nr:hypothetical protein [Mucilaginibacter sp.]